LTHTIRDEDGKIYVPVYYDVISAETDKAYCFATADKEVWLPKRLAVEKGLA
jgi:hypothetical protein